MDELPEVSDLPADPEVLALPTATEAPHVPPSEIEPRSHNDDDESAVQ